MEVSPAGLPLATSGANLASVKCQGEWLTVGETTDAVGSSTLTIDISLLDVGGVNRVAVIA